MPSINNHDYTSHINHLPRGYFKKRKPPDYASTATTQKPMCSDRISFSFSKIRFVNTNILLILMLVLGVHARGAVGDALQNSIEESLRTTTTMPPQNSTNDGICKDINIRFEVEKLSQLNGCRVVEGSVIILMLDDIKESDVENVIFPDLVEITGYLMLYRISVFKSLNALFPNLAIIRGRTLFRDYALIIYEMLDLTEIGLTNLLEIERGSVRIEKNEQMCFTETIDWRGITKNNFAYIEKNKLSSYCPVCPTHCRKSSEQSKTHLCWNGSTCQRDCTHCSAKICSPNGTCCHESCAGGCKDGRARDCIACKNYIYGNSTHFECKDTCPPDTYAYINRRCLTKKECYDLNKSNPDEESISPNKEQPFIPFEGKCLQECPQRYSKSGTGDNITCVKCGDKCLKRCTPRIIDSIATAQTLKGCSIVEGALEIQIRGTTKNADAGRNIVKELEASLVDIIEIDHYLKIARSHPILSLSFLKNLKRINGNQLETGKNAIMVWENQNLEELFDENQQIEIKRGQLFFYYNPKLCFDKIEKLAKKIAGNRRDYVKMIENYDTAKISNGDKTPCNVTLLNVTVQQIFPQAALLEWQPIHFGDERKLLNYVVFYIMAPYANVTLWDGRDACGNDGWNVEDVNDFSHTTKVTQPLTKLEPYTQYAYYVKAYTVATEGTGAQSLISYFTTKPDMPDRVKKVKVTALSSDKLEVTWETLKKVNGMLDHYILRAKSVDQNENLLSQRNFCKEKLPEPILPIQPPKEPSKEPLKPPSAPNGYCDCKACSAKCDARPQEDGEDRLSAIDFEDEIQDFVYIRNIEIANGDSQPKENRAKRQVSQVDVEFPDSVKDVSVMLPPQTDRESLKKSSDFYNDTIPADETSFIIKGLKHFTNYAVSIRACRKREEGEDASANLCGPEVKIYAQTFKAPSNDDISVFEAKKVTNGSSTDILVSWSPPPAPNGLVLTYTIKLKRVDSDYAHYEYLCIPHDRYSSSTPFIISGKSAGNYSIEIMATSLAGEGNYTKPRYVLITDPGNSQIWYLAIGLFIFLALIIVILCFVFKRYYLRSISNMKLIANVNPDYVGVTYKQDEWEIPREKVLQLQELGQGSFGMVYEGIIKDLNRTGEQIRCAIKTVNENATDKERISFLNEASVMKQFDTHHVVRLLGVVSRGQPTFVIMELMSNGDLKGYLRSHRPEYDNGTEPPPQPPTLRRILQMAIEIADGMSYLAAKKFVHRDLAARNCMVAEDLTVKIGDFGMTRDIYETDYYRKGTKGLLPVRWMSPESLKDGVFTSSSDVFSYGVVLWEMSTMASQPYQGLSNDQVLRYVIDGGVMERPENCPDKLYELMRRCWQHRPSARPSFMDIISMLVDDVSTDFEKVSFYHSPAGQDILHQMMQGELAVQITDDVTTPLRQDEEETSSIDNNHFLMEEVNSNHHRLDDL